MVSLQVNRTGFRLMGIESSARDSGNLLTVNNGLTVENYGYPATVQR